MPNALVPRGETAVDCPSVTGSRAARAERKRKLFTVTLHDQRKRSARTHSDHESRHTRRASHMQLSRHRCFTRLSLLLVVVLHMAFATRLFSTMSSATKNTGNNDQPTAPPPSAPLTAQRSAQSNRSARLIAPLLTPLSCGRLCPFACAVHCSGVPLSPVSVVDSFLSPRTGRLGARRMERRRARGQRQRQRSSAQGRSAQFGAARAALGDP